MNEKRPISTFLPLFLGLAMAIGFGLGHYFNSSSLPAEDKEQVLKINSIINYIEEHYVDDVEREKLVERSISSMLNDLDPHSAYIPASLTEAHNESLNGHFAGVGIQFRIYDDSLMVVDVVSGGPSEEAGILPGDRILEVDNEPLADDGITNQEVLDKLKGQVGTPVEVLVWRNNEEKTFHIIRGIIPLKSIDAYFMLENSVGYIQLGKFSRTTSSEFLSAVQRLKLDGMEKLILDLRNNRGGYLDQAINLADEILKSGELIVYTDGAHAGRKEYKATATGRLEEADICVLINEESASASEILAGALQDNDRAFIVGRRSFGKGLVQEPHTFNDGSELRLTIARYYTPSGRCIQKPYKGVDYDEDFYNRIENGELYHLDSTILVDSLKYETKYKKRAVYGGGGIIPDYFVPFDSSYMNTNAYGTLRYTSDKFVFYFLDAHRNRLLLNYPDYRSFVNEFTVGDELLNELVEFTENKEDYTINLDQLEYSKPRIKLMLKESIAYALYDMQGRLYWMSTYDTTILKAKEILDKE